MSIFTLRCLSKGPVKLNSTEIAALKVPTGAHRDLGLVTDSFNYIVKVIQVHNPCDAKRLRIIVRLLCVLLSQTYENWYRIQKLCPCKK